MSENYDRYHIKQLSIFAENKPGRIAAMAKVMRDNSVNILGFSIAEGAGYGVIRVIVDKPELAHEMLTRDGFIVKYTDVLAVEMLDRPGGLYELTDMLGKAGVNVEYGYGYRNEPCAVLIIRVENVDDGIAKILAHGAKLLDVDHFQSSCTK